MDKVKLVEISKGKTGTGLLVENDGFISLDLKDNKIIKEAIETEGAKLPKPFIVSAVFQKYGIENANGRVYPEEVLKREVEKYQQAVAERRAYGECYKPDVLCLTENGWKQLSEIKVGDNILTLNTDTNVIEIHPVENKISYEYDGDMIRIQGRHINDCVTPNHKFPIYNRNKKFMGYFSAQELAKDTTLSNEHCYIPKMGKWAEKIDFCYNDSFSSKSTISKGISLSKEDIEYAIESYHGIVECLDVANHNWFVMSEGKCHWTGNCNHPDQVSVDLGRIAMNIISLEWQGHTLVGKMEIPISDGFRNYGVISSFADMVAQWIISGLKIGVSSRGVGTVMQEGDHLVVGDDYSIICWDVVSTPSTPNAWIETAPEKLQPYIESKQEKKPLIKEDKFTKFEQWLNG